MNSALKNGFVSNILCLSILGLPLAACEGVEGDAAATAPAPTDAPARGTVEEKEVISAVMGPDGQVQTTKVRIPGSQWQQMLRQRLAAAADQERAEPHSSSVDRIEQGFTIYNPWCDSSTSWFFSGNNYSGILLCLKASQIDAPTTDMEYDVGFSIHSYISGQYAGRGLICTSNADCNLYQCGYGASVWLDAGGSSPSIYQPPYQSYLSPHWVHMQPHAPFPCR